MSFFIHFSFCFVIFLFCLFGWDCYNATYCTSKCTTPSRVQKGQGNLWTAQNDPHRMMWRNLHIWDVWAYRGKGSMREQLWMWYPGHPAYMPAKLSPSHIPFISVCSLSVHWVTPQSISLLDAPSLLIIISCFFWLTHHPQKMFASPSCPRLDTLARSHSESCLKEDSQLGPALFIETKTCSHSGGPFLFCILPHHGEIRLPHHRCSLFWCQMWTFVEVLRFTCWKENPADASVCFALVVSYEVLIE